MKRTSKINAFINKVIKALEEYEQVDSKHPEQLIGLYKKNVSAFFEPGIDVFMHVNEISNYILSNDHSISEIRGFFLSKTMKEMGFKSGVRKVKGKPVRGYYLNYIKSIVK